MPLVINPYEVIIVHDNTLTVLESSIENTTGIEHGTRAPGFDKCSSANTNSDIISEKKLLTKSTATLQTENNKYVVDGIIRDVIEDRMTKYVVAWYRYPSE